MTVTRVALFAEDRNFVDFLVPTIEFVARQASRKVTWTTREPVHGCRARRLKLDVEQVLPKADLVVVGADAAGRDHASRGRGHKRKRSDLEAWLGNDPRIVVTVADPCVEAWLFCHPQGFARGLEQALGAKFRKPSTWPIPETEAEAKGQLGLLIHRGLDADLSRNGFEFAREIVECILSAESGSPSLKDCVSDIKRALVGVV